MTKEPIIIDENICDYYSDTKEDEEGANPVVGWCFDNNCKCEDIPFDECVVKAVQYCKLKDKQLKRKKKECEELKSDLTELSKIIDCKNGTILIFKQQLDQLKTENELLKINNAQFIKDNEFLAKRNSKLKAENEELQEKIKAYDEVYSNHDVLNERNNYKQALQEIKNLTENACCKDLESCKICVLRNSCTNQKILQFLQKCEVIDG